jgi:hypothetical protein
MKQATSSVVGSIFLTTDYSLFRVLGGNRNIIPIHVTRLIESFKDQYLISPITINESFEIIDGQHRFTAARELGLPIYYIICPNYGLKHVQMLNTNAKNWNKQDYLRAYVDLGYPEYVKLAKLRDMFPEFGIASLMSIAADFTGISCKAYKDLKSDNNKSGNFASRPFENGKFVVGDIDKAISIAQKIVDVREFYAGYNRMTFVRTMVYMLKHPNYDHQKFMDKLRNNPTMLVDCANMTQYKEVIEDIYNFRNKNKVTLRF